MNQKSKVFMSLLAVILVLSMGVFSFMFTDKIEDAITGFVTARAFILESQQENCTVVLKQGFNTPSFICETGRSIQEAFSNNESVLNYSVIYLFDSTNEVNPWRINKQGMPSNIVQSLQNIRRNEGYIVIMNEEGIYDFDGLLSAQTSVQLREGWNLVGFPLNDERAISDATQSIESVLVRIETYEDGWKIYVPSQTDQIQTMRPMQAYWILVTQNVMWSVT